MLFDLVGIVFRQAGIKGCLMTLLYYKGFAILIADRRYQGVLTTF